MDLRGRETRKRPEELQCFEGSAKKSCSRRVHQQSDYEQEKKFWKTPDLIENLKRSSPLGGSDVVGNLVKVLKLMEEPVTPLQDLLDAICEASSADNDNAEVQMGCPRHLHSHMILLYDFHLLEEVESAFGTTEMTVEAVNIFVLKEPTLSVLGSRLSRQQGKMARLNSGVFKIQNLKSAEAFKTLMQTCVLSPIPQRREVSVLGEIWKGWGNHWQRECSCSLERCLMLTS